MFHSELRRNRWKKKEKRAAAECSSELGFNIASYGGFNIPSSRTTQDKFFRKNPHHVGFQAAGEILSGRGVGSKR